ncbi:hypothetical protein Scel_86510 [Streptomyces cellostaticus]|nr:hypothetical protein Scel_86510 [Streptomyces cellostaticus]
MTAGIAVCRGQDDPARNCGAFPLMRQGGRGARSRRRLLRGVPVLLSVKPEPPCQNNRIGLKEWAKFRG